MEPDSYSFEPVASKIANYFVVYNKTVPGMTHDKNCIYAKELICIIYYSILLVASNKPVRSN